MIKEDNANMKSLIRPLVCLFTLLVLTFSLCACIGIKPINCIQHTDKNGDNVCDVCDTEIAPQGCRHTDADENYLCDLCEKYLTPDVKEGELALVKNGAPFFSFVIGDDAEIAEERIDYIINTLNPKLKSGIRKITPSTTNDVELDCEIIIGASDKRDDKYVLDGHDYGYSGYAIKIIDEKIVVSGGSDEALINAVTLLESKLFDLFEPEKIGAIIIDEGFEYEKKQNEYNINSITIFDRPISDYTITTLEWHPLINTAVNKLQKRLYLEAGCWIDIVDVDDFVGNGPEIKINIVENTYRGNGFYVRCDGEDLVIECEFAGSLDKGITSFFEERIFSLGSSDPIITRDEDYTINLRDIYYRDFGAVGDGETDDFFAIKAAHEFANEDGHTVHADPDAIYYFGKGSGTSTIEIKTDTFWHGCKFIFDDHEIEPGSNEYRTSIFTIAAERSPVRYSGTSLPFTSLREGDNTVGWAPGFRAMIIVINSNVKHFIRYGPNQDNGANQTELILVDKDGNIDPSTPVQWTYEEITTIDVINVEDRPIIVDGIGDGGERTLVETIFNNAPSEYTYYRRNITITRSNAKITGVEHIITGQIPQSQGGTGAPYQGFTSISRCENSNVDNFIFQMPENYNTIGSAGSSVGMGTYELSADYANNILWSNCTQSNFYEKNGSVKFHGMMGTNYCKNLTFDNMFVCSFDAHKGTYNATLKNSTCEHINFIGEGTITLQNMTIYTDGTNAALVLRDDYGSTWEGELLINGLDLRYSTAKKSATVSIFKAIWYNHYFGYQTHLPWRVSLTNVTLSRYDYGITSGERWEKTVGTNEKKLYIVPSALSSNSYDITDADTKIYGEQNKNPYMPIKRIEMHNCGTLSLYIPSTPLFADTELWINDVKQ